MAKSSESPGTSIRVAIVDDHRLVLDGIVAHLSSSRLGIEVVASESNWLDLLANDAFPADVVVLDLNLADNVPIGTKIRAISAAGSRTIVMSRHADATSIYTAINAGALAFIPKTETADELVAAIRSAATGIQHQNQPLIDAMAGASLSRAPGLGRREMRALVLYASGRTIKEVAREMETTEETVKSYIKRGRRKYRESGVDLGSKILLRSHGMREGWLPRE
jgi:DNA-binding NarL/FixJ family response regulator